MIKSLEHTIATAGAVFGLTAPLGAVQSNFTSQHTPIAIMMQSDRYVEGMYINRTNIGIDSCNVTHAGESPDGQIVECIQSRSDGRTLKMYSVNGKLTLIQYDFGDGNTPSYMILPQDAYGVLQKQGEDMSGWLVEGSNEAEKEIMIFESLKADVINPENRVGSPNPPTMPATRAA
jgi:hypothetical protein